MGGVPQIEVTVDANVDAGYVRLSRNPVHTTQRLTDEVLVDLDELGMVVGIEALSLTAEIPIAELISTYHVRSEVADLLVSLQPKSAKFSVTSSSEASSNAASGDLASTAP